MCHSNRCSWPQLADGCCSTRFLGRTEALKHTWRTKVSDSRPSPPALVQFDPTMWLLVRPSNLDLRQMTRGTQCHFSRIAAATQARDYAGTLYSSASPGRTMHPALPALLDLACSAYLSLRSIRLPCLSSPTQAFSPQLYLPLILTTCLHVICPICMPFVVTYLAWPPVSGLFPSCACLHTPDLTNALLPPLSITFFRVCAFCLPELAHQPVPL